MQLNRCFVELGQLAITQVYKLQSEGERHPLVRVRFSLKMAIRLDTREQIMELMPELEDGIDVMLSEAMLLTEKEALELKIKREFTPQHWRFEGDEDEHASFIGQIKSAPKLTLSQDCGLSLEIVATCDAAQFPPIFGLMMVSELWVSTEEIQPDLFKAPSAMPSTRLLENTQLKAI